jgi:hypothetical protein
MRVDAHRHPDAWNSLSCFATKRVEICKPIADSDAEIAGSRGSSMLSPGSPIVEFSGMRNFVSIIGSEAIAPRPLHGAGVLQVANKILTEERSMARSHENFEHSVEK